MTRRSPFQRVLALPELLQWLLLVTIAASSGYWVLQLAQDPRPLPVRTVLDAGIDTRQQAAAATALFGQARAEANRFRLWGVLGGAAGAALIGIDDGAPKAWAVGSSIAPGVVLQATGFNSAVLEQGGQRLQLRLNPSVGSDTALPGLAGTHAESAASQRR